MKKILSIAFLVIALSNFAVKSSAEAAFPFDRPINIVIPFGAGGSVDITTRIIADFLLQKHDININVINKPGGSQAIGMSEILRARPDGYTMVFPTFSSLATTPKISNVGYTLDNFKPIAQIMVIEPVYSVHTDSPIKTFTDFIELAKTDQDTVYATTAAISIQRLYTAQLLNRFHDGMPLRHITYNSNHEVSTALLGKHITAGCSAPSNVVPYVKSGHLRALAISRSERHPALPDVPTIAEIYANVATEEDNFWINAGSWGGLLVSSKVSDDIVKTFVPFIEEALSDPEVVKKLQNLGVEPAFLAPAEFAQVISESSEMVDKVLQGRKTLD